MTTITVLIGVLTLGFIAKILSYSPKKVKVKTREYLRSQRKK